MKFSLNEKTGEFTLTGTIEADPQPSKASGKNLILASTRGFWTPGITRDGKAVRVSLNVIA